MKSAFDITDYAYAADTGKYHPVNELVEIRRGSYVHRNNPMFNVNFNPAVNYPETKVYVPPFAL